MIVKYKQCELKKGSLTEVAWIPAVKAIKGKSLRIKMDGEWQDKWVVMKIYDCTLDEDMVLANSLDYRNQRKASDIDRQS